MSFVSAYFTIYAYEKLKDQLNTISSLDFLFGEPKFVKSLDPNRTDKKTFKIEDEGLSLVNKLTQKAIARDCAKWITDKVKIRSIRKSNLMHGKMYYIENNGQIDALTGSANFTVNGLGLAENANIELNLIVQDNRDREDVKRWFDSLWTNAELVEDVKPEVLSYLEQLYQDNNPEFLYYKTLYHLFEKFIAEQDKGGLLDSKLRLDDTGIWKSLYRFQVDGVKGAINKILQHNGCIIADSVGLGKTYEALAIIKYFELLNYRILVLCPKKLRENWTVYQVQNNSALNPFLDDKFNYTVLSHTDLSRSGGTVGDVRLENLNWGNYDLVVIDESHNFRNDSKGTRDEDGKIIRKSRYEKLLEDVIKSGVRTKVLMLSATPVNTNLRDLRNQIRFITAGEDDAFAESLNIANLGETLKVAQTNFTKWAESKTHNVTDLLDKLDSGFFTLLDELTIARSRRHIEKYYDLSRLGKFPVRNKPISYAPDIDTKGRFMSYDKLNDEILNYQLSLFKPSKFLKDEYNNLPEYTSGQIALFKQSDRENFLIGMMKVNYLKRLESSVHSFKLSMKRTVEKIEALEDKIKNYKKHKDNADSVDVDDFKLDNLDDEEVEDAWQVGAKLKYKLAHLELDKWLASLAEDKRQLHGLYLAAKDVDENRDAKLATLKEIIENKVKHPANNRLGQPNRKILLFTAFADTAVYLYHALERWARKDLEIHIALVTGGSSENKATFGKSDYNSILTNFSPVSKQRGKITAMDQTQQIDLLIATDCISEGQNLQDCDMLINYDIHWNPVRIIQRFGRIDRLGSINDTIQLINFWPTKDLNKYINLKDRVEARMALVDISATAADNILKPEQVEDLIKSDLQYRDRQLLRLKDEILDLEEVTESVTLSEFTLDDFRIDLMNFIKANEKALQEAPYGLFAVVPETTEKINAKKGVIFCLRQKGDSAGNEEVNPLQPYFMVFVQDDGEIRYNFTHPKQILEVFRGLCQGKSEAYDSLCRILDSETSNCSDMSRYNVLLDRAVNAISKAFKKRAVGKLFGNRDGVIPVASKQVESTEQLELITWLIIK